MNNGKHERDSKREKTKKRERQKEMDTGRIRNIDR